MIKYSKKNFKARGAHLTNVSPLLLLLSVLLCSCSAHSHCSSAEMNHCPRAEARAFVDASLVQHQLFVSNVAIGGSAEEK